MPCMFNGYFWQTSSATAEYRPPIKLWFSQVTTCFVFLIDSSIVFSSNGLITFALIYSAFIPSFFNSSTAFLASATIIPVAIIVTSVPSSMISALNKWNL